MTPTANSGSEHPSLAKELLDLEVHILGSIMVEPTLLEHVASRIKPEYFQGELHRRIYRAMLYKHSYGISPNLQSLCLEARPYGLLENVGKHTLAEMAERIATTACIDDSVKYIVERYEQQELDGLQMQGPEALEKQGDVSQIVETLNADLDGLEMGHENLASLDTHGGQLSKPNNEPHPAFVGTIPSPAVDTRPHSRPPRGAAKFAYFAPSGKRIAKPLAMVTLIVGAGLLAWFAGRWSAMVTPRTPRVHAVAPMLDQGAQVASKVLSGTAKAANAAELAQQQTTNAPTVVPPAGGATQASQEVIQPSTPLAPQDATPRVQAPAPRRKGALVYAVNVSSFRSAAGAAVEVARLKARGYQARSIRTDLESKGVWYRVYVGQYATEAEAKQARAEILNQTDYGTAYVRSMVLF